MSLYKKYNIKDKLDTKSNILIILPSKNYDVKKVKDELFLDEFEFDITYPKDDDSNIAYEILMHEIGSYELAIQFECNITRKLLSYKIGEINGDLLNKIRIARGENFVNLHHHDDYSVRDGLGTVGGLVELLKARKQKFCCISNHGSIGGWITQYLTCKRENIKPIFAIEAYVQNYRGDDPELKRQNRKNFHLLLIAKNEEGYRNIIKIHNDAQLDGFYYKPRCNHEAFKKWGSSIIGSSACLGGEIAQYLKDDNFDKAKETYDFYKSCFDDFYIELVMIDMQEQIDINKKLIEFAKKVDAKIIVSCDSHYIYPEYNETHELLLLIRSHKTKQDAEKNPEEVWQFEAKDLYCKNEEQIKRLWNDKYKDDVFTEEILEEAFLNTRKIALSCEDITIEQPYKLPKLYDNAKEELRKHAEEGLYKRGLKEVPGYKERLEKELNIINGAKLSDYFLIVEKIVKDTKEKWGEFAVGPGRGSAAGSLVAYCLEITDIDPIRHKLLFERFLDESRGSVDMPDIDLDFHPKIRDLVKKDIVSKFGEKQTCSIGTYQRYKTKAVIIDIARVLGLDVWEAMAVTKKLESHISVEEDGEEEETFIDTLEFEDLYEPFPELKEYFDKYPEVLYHAKILRNQVKNMGKHAGGMIISNLNLQEYVPVFRDKNDHIVTTWAEGQAVHELSIIGLVKFDLLSLCLEENTLIKTDKGDIPIKFIDDFSIEYLDENGNTKYTKDFLLIESGEKDLIEIVLEDGERIKCTKEHKFFIF